MPFACHIGQSIPVPSGNHGLIYVADELVVLAGPARTHPANVPDKDASKSLPAQTANKVRSCGSLRTGTGRSGTAGGLIFAIGLGISSSSSSQRQKACRPR
jgi:hypothetical protein